MDINIFLSIIINFLLILFIFLKGLHYTLIPMVVRLQGQNFRLLSLSKRVFFSGFRGARHSDRTTQPPRLPLGIVTKSQMKSFVFGSNEGWVPGKNFHNNWWKFSLERSLKKFLRKTKGCSIKNRRLKAIQEIIRFAYKDFAWFVFLVFCFRPWSMFIFRLWIEY